jgi:hypothetical protein
MGRGKAMTRDDIIRMAREAGIGLVEGASLVYFHMSDLECFAKLVAAATKREWQGLTDEEIAEILDYGEWKHVPQYARNFVDAIEAKLKEKNT